MTMWMLAAMWAPMTFIAPRFPDDLPWFVQRWYRVLPGSCG